MYQEVPVSRKKEILSLVLGNYYKYLYFHLLKFIVKERKGKAFGL